MSGQLPLSKPKKAARSRRQVIYEPPSRDAVNRFARSVCRELAHQHPEFALETPHVNDFINFVRVVVNIQTKYLNKGGL